jgi:uncharacterized repeat protein (TIGR03943 family)
VTRDDGGLIVVGVGLLALWVGLTDAIYRYLRPAMKPWLVLAGATLIVLGLAVLVTSWWDHRRSSGGTTPDPEGESASSHQAHEHRRSRVGWLLGLPLVVAVLISPGPLGSYAVGRQSQYRYPTSTKIELGPYLKAHSLSGQTPELTVTQIAQAARYPADAKLLSETPFRVQGFVASDSDVDGFLVARLVVGCCAGDAVPISVLVPGAEPPGDDDTWVSVEATLDLEATNAAADEDDFYSPPVLKPRTVHKIDQPSEPYLYP